MASSRTELVNGYLSAFGYMLAATTSALCSQALQGTVPDFELSATRSLIQVVFYVLGAKLSGADLKVKREMTQGLLGLGFGYLAANVGYYSSTVYLPLAEANGMYIIMMIVFTLLHSRLFYNIQITKDKIISLVVSLFGIILAAQPSWLFDRVLKTCEVPQHTSENISHVAQPLNISSQYEAEVSRSKVLLGYMLCVFGGFGHSFIFNTSRIVLKDIQPIVKITYAIFVCLVGSVAVMFYMDKPVLMMNVTQFMLVLGHGVLSAFTSFLLIRASHYIPGPTLSALCSLEMVLMILFQYTIMHSIQPGNHNLMEVIGCVVIMIGGSIPSLVDILAHRAKSDEIP